MIRQPTAHDHGNCQLCDAIEQELSRTEAQLEEVRSAFDDFMEIGGNDGYEHARGCVGHPAICKCHRYRELARQWREVTGCDTCQDRGVVPDPLGPDMGTWDVTDCPTCSPRNYEPDETPFIEEES